MSRFFGNTLWSSTMPLISLLCAVWCLIFACLGTFMHYFGNRPDIEEFASPVCKVLATVAIVAGIIGWARSRYKERRNYIPPQGWGHERFKGRRGNQRRIRKLARRKGKCRH